jgi:hypothetical protein
MNRERIKIAWKFDRKTARRKFAYKNNLSSGQRPSLSGFVFRPRLRE